MNNLEKVKTISDLLETFKKNTTPVLALLCVRCGNNQFLINLAVEKTKRIYNLDYYQLSEEVSRTIKKELKIIKNPVLIVIKNGQIKALLEGVIPQYQLQEVLHNLLLEEPSKKTGS